MTKTVPTSLETPPPFPRNNPDLVVRDNVETQEPSNFEIDNVQDPTDGQLSRLRFERNRLLAETDWTQLPDNGLTEDQVAAWKEHRQRLRDVTKYFQSLNEVQWPVFGQSAWPSEPTQPGGAQSPQFTGGEVVQEDNPLFTPGT